MEGRAYLVSTAVRRDQEPSAAALSRNAATSAREILGTPGRRSSCFRSMAWTVVVELVGQQHRVDERPVQGGGGEDALARGLVGEVRLATLVEEPEDPGALCQGLADAERRHDHHSLGAAGLGGLDERACGVGDQVRRVLGLADPEGADHGVHAAYGLGQRIGVSDVTGDRGHSLAPGELGRVAYEGDHLVSGGAGRVREEAAGRAGGAQEEKSHCSSPFRSLDGSRVRISCSPRRAGATGAGRVVFEHTGTVARVRYRDELPLVGVTVTALPRPRPWLPPIP